MYLIQLSNGRQYAREASSKGEAWQYGLQIIEWKFKSRNIRINRVTEIKEA